jgi:hypothetical protein
MKYWVVAETTAPKLADEVNRLLARGWKLKGETRYARDSTWYQVMIYDRVVSEEDYEGN